MLHTFPRRALLLATSLLLALAAARPLRAGVDRWTSAGPPGLANVRGVSFDPSTPGTLYLSTGASDLYASTSAGTLYVSTDGGDSWRLLENAPPGLLPPLVSTAGPRALYANRGDGSVWKSADGGASWHRLADSAKWLLAIDPATGTLYATNGGTRLIKSVDGGATFTAVPFDVPVFGSDLFAVAVDRAHPGTIYVSTSDALYRSTDGGAHWTAGGSIDDFGPADLTVAPAGGSVLYGRAYFSLSRTPCLVRSTDAGSTFMEAASPVAAPSGVGCLWAADPLADRTVHVLTGSAADPNRRQAFTSRDAGDTWQAVGEGPPGAEFLAVDPLRPNVWYAGTLDRGIFRSADSGHSFTAINRGLSGSSFDLAVAAPGARSAVYAASLAGGLFSTRNAGRTWRQLLAQRVTALAVDPASPLHLVAGLSGGNLETAVFAASTDGGVSFASPGGAAQPLGVTHLAFDPTNSRVLYAGTVAGEIWKSADGGQRWLRFGRGLPVLESCDRTFCPNQPVSAIAIDPADPRIVYAVVGGRVFKSVNGGRRFGAAGNGLGGASIRPLVLDPAHPATLWAGACGGLFKSVDGGASWSESSTGLPVLPGQASGCVWDLLFDPGSPSAAGTLYAAVLDSGVFRSLDGGDTWSQLAAGLGHPRVEALALEQPSARLWAATDGSGLYVGVFTNQ